jgi:hypothetical protein
MKDRYKCRYADTEKTKFCKGCYATNLCGYYETRNGENPFEKKPTREDRKQVLRGYGYVIQ